MVTTTRILCTLATIWVVIFLSLSIFLWNVIIFFSFQLFLSLSVCRYPHFVTSELFKLLNDIRHRYKLNNKQYKMLVITQLNIMPLKKSSLDTFVFYVVLILCYFPMFLNLVFMGTNTKTKMTQKWNLYASIV